MALAMWAITTLVAPVVGPVLGGWITDNISWPWIFYINVPVGIAAALATWAIYHKRETPTAKVPVDAVGLSLLIIWVGAMQVMLDKGKDLDWFNSPTIVTLACVAVVGFAAFIIWELTEEHPVVDLVDDAAGQVLQRDEVEDVVVLVELAFDLHGGTIVVAVEPLALVPFVADEVAGAEHQMVLGHADFEALAAHGRHRLYIARLPVGSNVCAGRFLHCTTCAANSLTWSGWFRHQFL